jgi:hypothetical protein
VAVAVLVDTQVPGVLAATLTLAAEVVQEAVEAVVAELQVPLVLTTTTTNALAAAV